MRSVFINNKEYKLSNAYVVFKKPVDRGDGSGSSEDILSPEIQLIDYRVGTIRILNPNGKGNIYYDIVYYNQEGLPISIVENIEYKGTFNVVGSIYTPIIGFNAKVKINDNYSIVATKNYNCILGGFSYNNSVCLDYENNQMYQTIFQVQDGLSLRYTNDNSIPSYFSTPIDSNDKIIGNIFGEITNIKLYLAYEGYIPAILDFNTYGGHTVDAPNISYDTNLDKVVIDKIGEIINIPLDKGFIYYYIGNEDVDVDFIKNNGILYEGPFTARYNDVIKAIFVGYNEYCSDISEYIVDYLSSPKFELDYTTGIITINNYNGVGDIYYSGGYYNSSNNYITIPETKYIQPIETLNIVYYIGINISAVVKFENKISPQITKYYESAFYRAGYSSLVSAIYWSTGNRYFSCNYESGYLLKYTKDNSEPNFYSTPIDDGEKIPIFAFGPVVTLKGFFAKVNCIPCIRDLRTIGGETLSPPPEIIYDENTSVIKINKVGEITLIPKDEVKIHYTIDGSEPTLNNGILYNGPFQISEHGIVLKAIVIGYEQCSSEIAECYINTFKYMYIEAVEDNSTISLNSTLQIAPNIEYSFDGITFYEWQHNTVIEDNYTIHTFDTIELSSVGDIVYFRGINETLALVESGMVLQYTSFTMTGLVRLGGSLQSLKDGKGFDNVALQAPHLFMVVDNDFEHRALFEIEDGFLSATELTPSCYAVMFQYQTNLEKMCSLPAKIAVSGAYTYMMYMTWLRMSDDGINFNFNVEIANNLPQQIDTYFLMENPYDVADWMGNTSGFIVN